MDEHEEKNPWTDGSHTPADGTEKAASGAVNGAGYTSADEPVADEKTDSADSTEGQVYTAAGPGYAFAGNATPEGNGYTTPTGGHGYVYAPDPSREPGNGSRHRVPIGVCMGIGIVLLALFCAIGFFSVFRYVQGSNPGAESGTQDSATEHSTVKGLEIITDPDDRYNTESDHELMTDSSGIPLNPQPSNGANTDLSAEETEAGNSQSNPEPVPPATTVYKKSPLRKDADGDGVADIELDKNGYVLTSAGTAALPTATVAYRVRDSVVEITTETVVQSNRVGQYVTSGAGSGVIISAEGFIVTNHHVIDGADSITVTLRDGTKYTGVLIGTDEKTDIAVIWIDPGNRALTVATLGCSFDLVVGEEILAIGNPLGSLGGTVTNGIISATERLIRIDSTDMTLLQISAPINPGNSGGGLFNLAGELVGIVNAKCAKDDVEGLGFAIPIDTAYAVILELIDHGYVKGRPTTGLTLVDVTANNIYVALYRYQSNITGVYVDASLFTDALRCGDLILSVNGVTVTSSAQIEEIVNRMAVGDTLDFIVYRNQKQVSVTLTLREYVPAYVQADVPAA